MNRWRASPGFTLVDLLVSLALLGLTMAGILAIVMAGQASYGWGAARVEAQQSARVALERMVKELREAGYDPTGSGLAAIVEADPARVTFQRDLNGNGVVDPTRERVTFLLRGSVLRRDAGAGAQPIIEGVRRFVLTYFDSSGAPPASPSRVASIRIELAVGARGPGAVMETQVTLRNGRY